MKIASVAEVKSQFSAFLKASEAGPVVVTRNGRPVAVIVGVQDEDEIERLLMAYSPQLRAILERSRSSFVKGSGSARRSSGRKLRKPRRPKGWPSQRGRVPTEGRCLTVAAGDCTAERRSAGRRRCAKNGPGGRHFACTAGGYGNDNPARRDGTRRAGLSESLLESGVTNAIQ